MYNARCYILLNNSTTGIISTCSFSELRKVTTTITHVIGVLCSEEWRASLTKGSEACGDVDQKTNVVMKNDDNSIAVSHWWIHFRYTLDLRLGACLGVKLANRNRLEKRILYLNFLLLRSTKPSFLRALLLFQVPVESFYGVPRAPVYLWVQYFFHDALKAFTDF